MRRILVLFALIVMVVTSGHGAGSARARASTRLLFVGNSLTYVNDVLGLVESVGCCGRCLSRPGDGAGRGCVREVAAAVRSTGASAEEL
jgi:hypothetical protein